MAYRQVHGQGKSALSAVVLGRQVAEAAQIFKWLGFLAKFQY